MITYKALNTTSGEPRFNFPKKLEEYEIDTHTFGDSSLLWCTHFKTKRGLTITYDYFLTGDEAHDFLEVVVDMLAVKYPDAVCSNFSFLTKE